MNQKKNMVTSTKLNMHKLNCELVSEFGLNTFWQDGIWNNLDIKLYLHISSIISGNAQYICNLTHVSWVPKKKIGILFGGGFTAPSATSSI